MYIYIYIYIYKSSSRVSSSPPGPLIRKENRETSIIFFVYICLTITNTVSGIFYLVLGMFKCLMLLSLSLSCPNKNELN